MYNTRITKDKRRYIVFFVFLFLFSETFAYRLKDDDVVVVGGVITNCIYDISTKGNVIEIPDILDGQTITGIGDYAFSIAGKIAVLTLPSTLKTIGNGVFEGHALTSLVIPSGVTTIGYRTFYGNALSSINLPAGLVTIGGSAFENNQLKNISLPNGVRFIGYSAFANNQIVAVNIPNTVETLESSAFYYNKITNLTFEAGCQLKEISTHCFYGNDIRSVIIPNSVQIVYDYAFSSNSNLTSVSFGTNILKIRRGAFSSCNLSSVTLPGSLVFIGRYAFGDNLNLKNFKLPTSSNHYKWNDSNGDQHNEGDVVSDKNYSYVAVIPYTLKNEDVVVQNGVITYCSYFDVFTNVASVITIPSVLNGQTITGITNNVFNDRGISEINLPQGIETIDYSAFGSNELIHLTIPNSVVLIGEYAFYDNCINTVTFEATSSLEEIGVYAFYSNRISKVDFPKSVVKIEKYAFSYNLIQSVTFQQNSKLISIGSYAFYNNWMLPNITLPDPKANNYEYWVDWDNNEYSANRVVNNFETFYKIPVEYTLTEDDFEVINGIIVGCTLRNPDANIITIPDTYNGQQITGIADGVFRAMGLIGVNLPEYLVDIGNSAFTENDIISVTIPKRVESIGGSAFSGNNINELIFEENSALQYIGWSAFWRNKITSLTLPDEVNSIGSYAFAYNRIANSQYIPDKVERIEYGAFLGNQIPELYFGQNSILSYLGISAFANNLISNEVFIPTTLTEISDYAFRNNRISKVITHKNIVEYGNGAFEFNNPSLTIILHEPPTIPYVTHFFGWKDNDGVYHDAGEAIPDFGNRYKAVIDQFFVVTFVVKDDNDIPIENATIEFYGSILTTDKNGIDSIGPVLRGIQPYEVSAAGCIGVNGAVDVQDDLTVCITLTRNYNVKIKIIDIYNNPVAGAGLTINDSLLVSNISGNVSIKLPDGEYPFVINSLGFSEFHSSVTVLDKDTSIVVQLLPVMVDYYPNGGMGIAYTDTTHGITYVTNNNTFSRLAYTFLHWNTKADDTGVSYTEKALFKLGYTDIDLYAIWKPVDYNIIYHLNGGTNNSNNPSTYTIESEINLLPASKPSLYFATWIDSDSNRVSRIEKGTSGNIELWAVFTPEPTYYIDYYNLENASHNNASFYTKFDLPLVFTDAYKRGYEFLGWFEDATFSQQITGIPNGSSKNYAIYAKWGNAIEYSISYHLDGGTNNSANPNTYTIESNTIQFLAPAKTGAKFVAWYSDENFSDEIKEIKTGSVGDTILYAQWELDTFNIHYILDGGINNPVNPNTYTIESNTINLANPEKEGFVFEGWFTSSDFSEKIQAITSGSTGDLTVYAKWNEIFKVEFIITTDGKNPARDVDIRIDNSHMLKSDNLGLADTLLTDGSSFNYSVEINEIVIRTGSVAISGSDVTVIVEIVDCYMRWFDVIFCDNGKGLWTNFVWFKNGELVSNEQFYHKPGGIENGTYTLKVTSVNGIEYIWEKVYENNKFIGNDYVKNGLFGNSGNSEIPEILLYPNPVSKNSILTLYLPENIDTNTTRILIYNVGGILVKTINNPLNINNININSSFASGLYHAIILYENDRFKTEIDFIVK